MLLIAGLSPAWQQILIVDRFQSGDLNRACAAYWCGSGKVLNAAVAAHHLAGGEATRSLVLSTLGGPAYGPIDGEFEVLGIRPRWVRTKASTRVCTTIVDRSTNSATELIENAGPITSSELEEFEAAFVDAAAGATAVLLVGSLPVGTPPEFFRQLLAHVHCPAVLDIRGPELLAALDARPAVIKPNREEIAQTLGKSTATDSDLEQAIGELRRRGAQAVVVSAGGGDVWLGSATGIERFKPLPVKQVVNPIGCGDCLAAGIAWSLGGRLDLHRAVVVGLEAAAANLQTLLPSDFDGRREKLCMR